MNLSFTLAQTGAPVLTMFSIFVACALLLSIWVTSDGSTTRDFYIGDRRQSPITSGLAMFGCYVSAATLLGSPGLVALSGYDGVLYLLGTSVTWVIVVLVVAEPYHNTGRFTIGDTLARRLRPGPTHLASGIATVTVSMLYLILQLVGAGALAAPVLGISGPGAEQAVVVALGILMILYVIIGGMRATTLVQAAKAVIVLGGGVYLGVTMLSRYDWSVTDLLNAAVHHSGLGEKFLRPGLRFGTSGTDRLDSVSLQIGMLLGAAGLPHVLVRLRTVRSGRAARRSAQWAAVLTAFFTLLAALLGFGAVGTVGRSAIVADNASGNTSILLLAESVGGSVLLTVMSCVAFATILAVVAGITLSAATSLAHDIYGVVIKKGTAAQNRELTVARTSVFLFGLAATGLSLFAQKLNIGFLMGLAFALAASAILPALLYSMYWSRFTTRGATWSIYGGLLSALLLVFLSPAVSGSPSALFPGMDFAVFPLKNPGLVSVPLAFVLGWLGSIGDREEAGGAEFAETEVRALTGAGAGRA